MKKFLLGLLTIVLALFAIGWWTEGKSLDRQIKRRRAEWGRW